MNLEQYAAQHPQEPQAAPAAPAAVDYVAAKLDADKLFSLSVQLQALIDARATPAEILTAMTGALFGPDSKQAADVAAIIDADKHPGGHEMAIATIRQRRRMLQQQARQLDALRADLNDEMARLDADERKINDQARDASALDLALLDALTACKALDPNQPDLLQQLQAIYNRHTHDYVAMGLLYGCMAELRRRQYNEQRLDLLQQHDFQRLRDDIAAHFR